MNSTLRISVFMLALAVFVGCDHTTDPGLKLDRRAVVERISPTSGIPGSLVTIYGSDLDTGKTAVVTVGAENATVRVHTADSLEITIPSLSTGAHPVRLKLGQDTISNDLTFNVLQPAPQYKAITLSLTGVIGEMYSTSFAKLQDTAITLDTIKQVTMTLTQPSSDCVRSGDTIGFCYNYTFSGPFCKCDVEIGGSGFMLLDTLSKTIRSFSLSVDSTTSAGRRWETLTGLSATNMPYTQSSDGQLFVKLSGVQLSDMIKNVMYREEYWSTAPGATTFFWLNKVIGFRSDAQLEILLTP